MNKRGQGALEYLLLIGGAILIAAIVLTVMTGMAQPADEQATIAKNIAVCVKFNNDQCGKAVYGADACAWNLAEDKCLPS